MASFKETQEKQKTEIGTLEDEKAEIKLQLCQLQDSTQDEIAALKQQVHIWESSCVKKD